MKPGYIVRQKYFEKVKPFVDTQLIKVFTGQRRTGKSFLMYQIMDYIKDKFDEVNIIYINKELSEFDSIENYTDLENYIKAQTDLKSKNFVFIDEVQLISQFEKALKSIFARNLYDIYVTGSNANMLSGELATLLSGRYVEIKVFPLDYQEFLLFHDLEDSRQALDKYLQFGGLPYLHNLPLREDVVFDYLQSVYQAILYKDIITRYNVRNANFLERLIRFLANNVGSPVSARNIVKYLKSQRVNIALTTVLDYLDYLRNAFLVNKVSRMDLQGKQVFAIGEKFYFTDIGIRNAVTGFSPFELNKIIENAVFCHLSAKEYNVFVGKFKDFEIDFVAEKRGEVSYYQVALRIDSEETVKREFGNLLKIRDNYPKYLITLDEYEGRSYEGIVHLPLRKFLLS